MKTAEEILNKNIINRFDEIDRNTFISAMKEYARQVAEQVRDECAEVAYNADCCIRTHAEVFKVDIEQFIK